MKKSKKLTIVLLVLAIVTALTAGTLAVYTTTIGGAMKTEVNTKRFFFTSPGSWGTDVVVKLAPGESYTVPYDFIVSTADSNGTTSEVDMELKVIPDDKVKAMLLSNIDIEIKLYMDDAVAQIWHGGILSLDSEPIPYEMVLDANKENYHKFKLEFTWQDTPDKDVTISQKAINDERDTQRQGTQLAESLGFDFIATQKTSN